MVNKKPLLPRKIGKQKKKKKKKKKEKKRKERKKEGNFCDSKGLYVGLLR